MMWKRVCFPGFIAVLLACVVPASTLSEPMQEQAGKAYREAYKFVIDENWASAIRALQALLKQFPNSDWSDDARFWICYANEKSDPALEKAFACYEDFVRTNARSEWVNDAKMNLVRLAGELAKQGKQEYATAAQALRAQADTEIELSVLVALLDVGDADAINTVLERVSRNTNDHVRARVVRALGDHTKSGAVVGKLGEFAWNDRSLEVRRNAVRALADSKNPEALAIVKEIALSGNHAAIRKTALRELGNSRLKSEEMVPLLRKVAVSDSDVFAREAVKALGDIRGAEAFKALTEIFHQVKSADLRRQVVLAAGGRRQDGAAVIDFLSRAAAGDDNPEVRRSSVYAIADLRTTAALEKLKEIAATAAHTDVRIAAYDAIGHFRGAGAVEALVSLVRREEDATLRKEAVNTLGEFRKDAAIPVLVELYQTDPNSDVRTASARALAKIGSPAAREALVKLLSERKEP